MSKRVLILFLLALAAPRAARMLAPHVWVEDDNYIYSAYLISEGQSPYQDFVQANPPLLEQLVAPLFHLFAANHRLPEALSALAVVTTALGLWRIGANLLGGTAGIWGACLFSLTPLLFRYHLFEREVFSLCFAVLGAAAVLGADRPGTRVFWRSLLGGALLAGATHFKQVGILPAVALLLELVLNRAFRRAVLVFLSLAIVGSALLGVDWLRFGPDVLLQSFLLHLIKGAPLPLDVRFHRLLRELLPLLPLAILGLWQLRGQRSARWLIFWSLLELTFIFGLSSTFWPHYMIPILGPICLAAGGAISRWKSLPRATWMAAFLGFIVLGIQCAEAPATRLGFAGVERRELREVAEVIASLVPEGSAELICPPIFALEANRLKRFSYIDTLGFTRQLQSAYRDGRLRELLDARSRGTFGQTLARANQTWIPEALEAIKLQQIRAVVPERELPIQLRPPALAAYGYRLVYRGRSYEVWAPAHATKDVPEDRAPS